MISRNWNLPQLFIFKLVKMELATIISLSTLLAATYSMNFLNKLKKKSQVTKTTYQIDRTPQLNVFKAENSLVFITDKKDLLVSGALLNKEYILTVSWPFIPFRYKNVSDRKLYVGIGTEPFNENVDEYLHPVDDYVHRFHRQYYRNTFIMDWAIMKFQTNQYGIPCYVRYIPLSRNNFPIRARNIGVEAVGWGKDGKVRKYPIARIDRVLDMHSFAILIDIEDNGINHNFKGGFLTHNGAIAGIVTGYRYPEKTKRKVYLGLVTFLPSDNFIRLSTNGKYGYDDFYQEERDSYLLSRPSSPVFSDIE